jgi:cell division protein FtsI/penicillin-binding protein 2
VISRRHFLGAVGVAAWPAARYEHLLAACSTRQVVEGSFAEPARPAPLGSVTKLLVAAAWFARHAGAVPAPQACRGGCWSGRAHGRVTLERALAVSCNNFFQGLAAQITLDDLQWVARQHRLPPPPPAAASWIGLGEGGSPWLLPPVDFLLTVPALVDAHPLIRDGLRLAAREGTGRAFGRPGLVKTGTAPCVHQPRHAGDGVAVALWPDDLPRWMALVRVPGAPGAEAARVAGGLRL